MQKKYIALPIVTIFLISWIGGLILTYCFYTQEEIDYFTEISVGSEYGGVPYILKWDDDVRIKINGNPTEENMNSVNKVVNELNSILKPQLKLSIVYDNPSIEVYFIPLEDFKKYCKDHNSSIDWAYFCISEVENYTIKKANVLIPIDKSLTLNQSSHYIREELTQPLGLMKDSWKYSDSIFYQGYSESIEYSELDILLIKTLYNEEIKPGMTKEEVVQVLKNLNKCSINYSSILVSIGLFLNILGSCIIVWKSAKKYIKSKFNKKVKRELEDEAIAISFGRYAGDRNENLNDVYVLNFLGDYKNAFIGFVLLILGFIMQLIGTLFF